MRSRSLVKAFSVLLAALVAAPLAMSGSVLASTPSTTAPPSYGAPTVASSIDGSQALSKPKAIGPAPRDKSPLDDALLYEGLGFDTCEVPSLEKMRAWRTHSPYEAIGVYIGGLSAGCRTYSDEHLTREWVEAAHAMGWRLIPTYVGRQASCAVAPTGKPYKHQIDPDPKKARAQAKNAANDAVTQMKKRGLGPGNPIYYDMEGWHHTNKKCTAPVLEFMDAWTVQLHNRGYVSGFYSSANNGLPAIVTAKKTDPSFHAPDAIWIGHSGTAANTKSPFVDDDVWTNHQRIKQFTKGHNETHGGVTINIDSDYVDGPVTGTVIKLQPASIPIVAAATDLSVTLKGKGGEAPYSFSIVSGELPPGLTLSKGKITGKTTKPGIESTAKIRVKDSGHPTRSGSRTYKIYTTFADMPKDQLFFGPVKWLAQNYITFGYDDGTFRPAADVNRGSMAAFLFRAANPGVPAPKCTTKPFPDVATGSLFCGHISWLDGQKITKPADGHYHASSDVTRGSMTAFLYRLTHPGKASPKCTGKPFKDVSTNNVFCGYIQWAKKNHVAKGYGDGTYGPNNAVTRGAMAAFLSRIDTLR